MDQLCTLCFRNFGVRREAELVAGGPINSPCPNCKLIGGGFLDRGVCEQLLHRFFVEGSIPPVLLCQVLARPGGSLRQAAKLTGVSVTTLRLDAVRLGVLVKPRPKTLTPLVISVLERDFSEGLSLSDIAIKEQISLASLYRVLRMRPLAAAQWRALRATRELVERRQRFLDDLCYMPLRHSSEYQWLYKHDRDWFVQQVVEYGKVPSRRVARVDWEQRDRLLAKRVEAWSETNQYLARRPTRVTLSLIGRELHAAALFGHFLDKLPLTRKAIACAVESPQQFHCRRLFGLVTS
ncbi:Uncharacterized protein ChrSV_0777 [Chromobacterium vaccinii]|nr:Uncharacterized protein ChrSW_0777 [Chromobacterium vaccinii]QND88236.1 Uncharacterized protein ChrSV_0777 [Chromobacterium vaccinii]